MAHGPVFNPGQMVAPKRYVRPTAARRGPEDSPYPNVPRDAFTFEYWFNYFYKELNPAKKDEYFLKMSPTPNVFRHLGANPGDISDAEGLALLQGMLDLGFRAFKTLPPDALAKIKPELKGALHERLTADELFKSLQTQTGGEKMRVLFRGDTRAPQMIKSVGGTRPQTRVKELSESRNFDKEWHPWKDPDRAGKVYFRNGDNQDNCLFTAISVTPEFLIATKFPMVEMMSAADVKEVDVEIERKFGGNPKQFAKRNLLKFDEKVDTIKLKYSYNWVYAVKVKKGFNTMLLQTTSTFPERAYENLRWIDHYAAFRVCRIHYGAKANDGHLVVIERSQMLPDMRDAEWNMQMSMKKLASFDPKAVEKIHNELKDFLRDITAKGRLINGMGGISCMPEGAGAAPFTIKRVVGKLG